MHKPNNKVLVTGGGSGLGRALALRWARSGAAVCIADIHEDRASQVVCELLNFGVDAFYVSCDITRQGDIESVKKAVEARWQGVDLVINNAGIGSADALLDESIAQWQQTLDVNLLGAVKVTKAFTPMFRNQGYGYFLNVASQAGITPIPKMASYNASKAALVSFSETMWLELADDSIGISVLCPGFFKTNLNESLKTSSADLAAVLERMMHRATLTAEDVAQCAFEGVMQNTFMILSHPEGKTALRMKRWFPKYYLQKMKKFTSRIRKN